MGPGSPFTAVASAEVGPAHSRNLSDGPDVSRIVRGDPSRFVGTQVLGIAARRPGWTSPARAVPFESDAEASNATFVVSIPFAPLA